MDIYFFHPDIYEQRYNCNLLSYEEWQKLGNKNEFLGAFTVLGGLIQLVCYFPFFVTMLNPRFLELSCYKFMVFLGIMDFLTIATGSLISGYLLVKGAVYVFSRAVKRSIDQSIDVKEFGKNTLASWVGSCCTCMLLTINRCIDVYLPEVSRILFSGWRTWVWLLIPVCVIIKVIMYEPAIIFNSNYIAWFFDPFFGMENVVPPSSYRFYSSIQSISNILTIVVLFLGNSLLFYYVFSKSSRMSNSLKTNRQFALQVFVICFMVMTTAFFYTYIQYFYAPKWLIFAGSLCYNFSSGAQPFTYFFLNHSLREASVKQFCGCRSRRKNVHTNATIPSKNNQTEQQSQAMALQRPT